MHLQPVGLESLWGILSQIVVVLLNLRLQGLIFYGFWAQRPHYTMLLGYFEPYSSSRSLGTLDSTVQVP